MKPNELRIGNLIHVDFHIAKVVSLNELGITPSIIERASQSTNSVSMSPIPLTEEWLIRFGFEKIKSIDFGDYEYHKYISKSEYLVWFIDNSMGIGGSKEEINKGICYCSNILFEHAHQLQNLYFALTGEELKLKEQ